MKTTAKNAARLLAAFALLLPTLWSCSNNAGDEPGEPTGPTTQYNPEMDYPGAKITVKASPSTMAPGESFTLLATFTDAEGRPVVGVPLGAQAEGGGIGSQYFRFVTNTTVTDTRGKASIQVDVASNCPNGSYVMMVFSTTPGPNAHGQTTVMVSGTGPESITKPSAPVGNTTPPLNTSTTYLALGSVNSQGHSIQYSFSWGDGSTSGWISADSANEALGAHAFNPACQGISNPQTFTFSITVKARCATHPSIVSPESNALQVTVTRNDC